jgi:outer membrane immunogenic protein
MQKILLAATIIVSVVSGSALAADMSQPRPAPVYSKAPAVMPMYSWTGCYIGGNGGGLFAKKDWTIAGTAFAQSSVNINSWVAGAQLGCNYQMGAVVLGIQGDYDWSNGSASAGDAAFLPVVVMDQSSIKSLASVTGRVGYAWDRFLFYGKGGGAWVKDNYSETATAFGIAITASETRTGWTAGVGGEYAFTDWLNGFVEYDYYGFGTKTNTFTVAGVFVGNVTDIKQTVSVAKGGFNIKFGGWH